jgi:hypothetical protein
MIQKPSDFKTHLFIDAARAGAPGATQVADRFHLLQNLAEVLDQVFSAHGSALKAIREAISAEPVTGGEGTVAVLVPPTVPTAIEEARAEQRRARRLAHNSVPTDVTVTIMWPRKWACLRFEPILNVVHYRWE